MARSIHPAGLRFVVLAFGLKCKLKCCRAEFRGLVGSRFVRGRIFEV